MTRDEPSSPAELNEILRSLLEPAGFADLTDPLLDPATEVDTLAAASYEHPNHFDKLVLSTLSGGQKIVLHAWWPGDGVPLEDGNLHDHRWHFATAVLAGTYRFVEYEETPAAESDGLIVHKHEYQACGSGHRLADRGRSCLRPVRSDRVAAGSSYLLDCEVIHSIALDAAVPTITLFVQGPPVRESTRVFSARPLGQADPFPTPRFTPTEYRARLARALSAVSDHSHPGK